MSQTANRRGPGQNQPAVVLWHKKRKNYTIYSFITPSLGIITCSVPHRRLHSLKAAGYLQPFSQVVITVQPADDDLYNLQQISGQTLVKSLEGNLQNICYTALAGELVMTFFYHTNADRSLYEKILLYARQIQRKSIPLATIILGWQLVSLAGFMPSPVDYRLGKGTDAFWDEVGRISFLSIATELKQALGFVLTYDWREGSQLAIGKSQWELLEKLLFAYVDTVAERPLESLRFLKSMGIELWD